MRPNELAAVGDGCKVCKGARRAQDDILYNNHDATEAKKTRVAAREKGCTFTEAAACDTILDFSSSSALPQLATMVLNLTAFKLKKDFGADSTKAYLAAELDA